MNKNPPLTERARDLIDRYIDSTIDASELSELEQLLREDDEVRSYFAAYMQLHTDTGFELAARASEAKVLARLDEQTDQASPPRIYYKSTSTRLALRSMVAASLILGMLIGGGMVGLLAAQDRSRLSIARMPRSQSLDFIEAIAGTISDESGLGTGLTHRLPGTGDRLPKHDPFLRLIPSSSCLEVTATSSDLNTQYQVERAQFPGIRLADLGFTGKEDFEITVTVSDIPVLEFVGQFGVYVGSSSQWAVRGGLVSQREQTTFRQFLVNTREGRDKDAYFVGLGSAGDDMRITLARRQGKYTMGVENRTSGATSTLEIRHPEFLDGRSDLVAGIFACDPRGKDSQAIRFGHINVTVWHDGKP